MLVYKITNLVDGKQYVGVSTRPLNIRWSNHLSVVKYRRRDGYLQRAIIKHGKDAFRMEFLEDVPDADGARTAERRYIIELGTLAPNGYNMTTGGERGVGHKHSAETIERLREIGRKNVTPQFIAMAGNGKGRKRTPEQCAAMSARLKGKPKPNAIGHVVSEETREKLRTKVLQKIADGTYIRPIPPPTPSTETRMKMSAAGKARMSDPVYAAAVISASVRGLANMRPPIPAERAIAGVKNRGRKRTTEMCERIKEGRRKVAKVNRLDVAEIKCRLLIGHNKTAIARDYNVSPSSISNIATGRIWSGIPATVPGFL